MALSCTKNTEGWAQDQIVTWKGCKSSRRQQITEHFKENDGGCENISLCVFIWSLKYVIGWKEQIISLGMGRPLSLSEYLNSSPHNIHIYPLLPRIIRIYGTEPHLKCGQVGERGSPALPLSSFPSWEGNEKRWLFPLASGTIPLPPHPQLRLSSSCSKAVSWYMESIIFGKVPQVTVPSSILYGLSWSNDTCIWRCYYFADNCPCVAENKPANRHVSAHL